MSEGQKTLKQLWEEAFSRLLPKAKNMDANALAALRNHYFPLIMQEMRDNSSDDNKIDIIFKRSFAKVIQQCKADVSEEEFNSQLFKTVSKELDVEKTNVINSGEPDASREDNNTSEPIKVDREVRPISEAASLEMDAASSSESNGDIRKKDNKDAKKSEKLSGVSESAQKKSIETKNDSSSEKSKKAGAGISKTETAIVVAALFAAAGIGLGVTLTNNNRENQIVNHETEVGSQRYKELFGNAETGSYVQFGTYEQDNDTSNGKEAIEWLVLAKEDNRMLLISKYGLDCQQYNTSLTDVTWETCSLRTWLNETFINDAFSRDEQMLIPSVIVSADQNPTYSTDPGNATTDKIFLLSISEAKNYFDSDDARKTSATTYTKSKGVYEDDDGKCFWWLRSPGDYSEEATVVFSDGFVDDNGGSVDMSELAVRPALWVSTMDEPSMSFDTGSDEDTVNYTIWTVEPSLPFDNIQELTTRPNVLPGIDMELSGYPQSWNSDYECNAIKVQMNGSYGVYDYYGNNLIPVCLSWLDCSPNGVDEKDIFVADYLGDPYYISTSFTELIPFVYGGLGSEPDFFFAFNQDGEFGQVFLNGRKFVKYDISKLKLSKRNAVTLVDSSLSKVGWVLADASGTIINGPYYNRPSRDVYLYPFVNSMVSVLDYDLETIYVKENEWKIAFVDANSGNQVTAHNYENAKYFQDGFAPVEKNGKWGFINEGGGEVSDFIFDDASVLYDGKSYVKYDGYYGIIDIRYCMNNGIRITKENCDNYNKSIAYVPQESPRISDGAIGTAVVKVDKLNIRSWGSTNADKVGQCNTGDTFTVYEITEDSKYTWYRIGKDRWIADKGGQYVHFHEEENGTSAIKYSDNELCDKAKKYYISVHGQEPPIVKVEGHNGDEVVIHLYEMIDNHMATWDWYYIDRTSGKGRDFASQSIDISSM